MKILKSIYLVGKSLVSVASDILKMLSRSEFLKFNKPEFKVIDEDFTVKKVNNEKEIKQLFINEIEVNDQIHTRVSIDDEIIEEYKEAMKEGNKFPPIKVFKDQNNNYLLVDGFYRIKASESNDQEKIECIIIEGTFKDALLESIKANKNHGLRRTNQDKRKCIELLLNDDTLSNYSDRHIANIVGIGHTFVAKVRKEHILSTGIGNQSKRCGRDGKLRSVIKRESIPNSDNKDNDELIFENENILVEHESKDNILISEEYNQSNIQICEKKFIIDKPINEITNIPDNNINTLTSNLLEAIDTYSTNEYITKMSLEDTKDLNKNINKLADKLVNFIMSLDKHQFELSKSKEPDYKGLGLMFSGIGSEFKDLLTSIKCNETIKQIKLDFEKYIEIRKEELSKDFNKEDYNNAYSKSVIDSIKGFDKCISLEILEVNDIKDFLDTFDIEDNDFDNYYLEASRH